jgi:hypothetical protein
LVSCGTIFNTSTPTISLSTNAPTGSSGLAEGIIINYERQTILIKTENRQVVLEISKNTVIWDGISCIAEIPIQSGDFVTAWGIWNSDNSLAVEKLYINIVNLQGTASNIVQNQDNASFSVTVQGQSESRIVISSLTKVYQITTSTQSTYKESHLLPHA